MELFERGSRLRAPNAAAVAVLLVACLSPAVPAENREAGFDDLVIMDPGAHQNGLPAVIFDDESREIEIPPALHIHRYYYSGDKEYQGPISNSRWRVRPFPYSKFRPPDLGGISGDTIL